MRSRFSFSAVTQQFRRNLFLSDTILHLNNNWELVCLFRGHDTTLIWYRGAGFSCLSTKYTKSARVLSFLLHATAWEIWDHMIWLRHFHFGHWLVNAWHHSISFGMIQLHQHRVTDTLSERLGSNLASQTRYRLSLVYMWYEYTVIVGLR